jgi:hypothetical protein
MTAMKESETNGYDPIEEDQKAKRSNTCDCPSSCLTGNGFDKKTQRTCPASP